MKRSTDRDEVAARHVGRGLVSGNGAEESQALFDAGGIPAPKVEPRPDVLGAPPLPEDLLQHPQRNVIPLGDLLTRVLAPLVSRHNPFAQILRYRSHANLIAQTRAQWL